MKEMVELGKAAVRVAKSLASAIPLSSEKVLTSRHAGESIVSFAEENESDLIIIGDSGHGRLHDFFLVARQNTCYVTRRVASGFHAIIKLSARFNANRSSSRNWHSRFFVL